MSLFDDMYDGIVRGVSQESEKETTEGKVPDPKDDETTTNKKLTEEEMVVAGDRVTSSDGTKEGKIIALVKDNPSIGIVKWDDVEAEIPVPLSNLKKVVEVKQEVKEDFAEEHGLGKAKDEKEDKEKEPEHEIENTAGVETPKEETPTITKEYVGKSEDTHFYLISKDAATGEREDFQIVDQEGIMKYSAKANNLDLSKVDDFIISAIKDVEIDQIERSIFVKYLLPRIEKENVAEQPEIEKEEEVEELKPKAEEKLEEEKATESKKVNEAIDSIEIYFKDLNEAAQKMVLEFYGYANSEEGNLDVNPLAVLDKEVGECKTCSKKSTKKMKKESTEVKEDTAKREIKIGDGIIWDIWPGKVVGEGSDQGKPVWKVILHGKKRDMPFDIPKGDDELRLAEGKVPAESDKEDTKIKKLIETKITDEEGNEFEVALVDDGTEDTVIDVNGREFRFSNEFANLWRDEEGNLSDEGLKELALDALANLEDDVYNELVGVGKEQVVAKEEAEEGGAVGEKTTESKINELTTWDNLGWDVGNLKSISPNLKGWTLVTPKGEKLTIEDTDEKAIITKEKGRLTYLGDMADAGYKLIDLKGNEVFLKKEVTKEKKVETKVEQPKVEEKESGCEACGKIVEKYVEFMGDKLCPECADKAAKEEDAKQKTATEGKVPYPKDDETTTNKKLTETKAKDLLSELLDLD